MTIFIIILITFFNVSAKEYIATPSQGQVVFRAKALGLKFEGQGHGVEGCAVEQPQVTGEFKFDLETLKTGLSLRDSHMKENYLETQKFPFAKLKLKEVVGFNASQPEGHYDFKGDLEVHGVTKEIQKGRVEIKKIANSLTVVALFNARISDFQIPLPQHAGLVVKDEVEIQVTSQMSPL